MFKTYFVCLLLSKRDFCVNIHLNNIFRIGFMKIIKIVNEHYGQNNFLCVEGSEAILIDASANVSQIEENLKMCGEKPKLLAILLTHEHFDHIAELDNLVAKYSCPVFIHKLGKANLYDEKHNLSTLDRPFKIKTK